MKKALFLKCMISASIIIAVPLKIHAQSKAPDIEQISDKPANNNIIFEQPALKTTKTVEPIIISVPQETQNEIIKRQIAKSTATDLGETNAANLPKDPKNVILKQPNGKDACDNDKARKHIQSCKNTIEQRAIEFENVLRPEINPENQEVSVTDNINLSRDANKTAQKLMSPNELEALAAAAVAQTYIAKQTPQTETAPTTQNTLPDNMVDLIQNKIQTPN